MPNATNTTQSTDHQNSKKYKPKYLDIFLFDRTTFIEIVEVVNTDVDNCMALHRLTICVTNSNIITPINLPDELSADHFIS